ncbi:hypothetical protein [Candidatus Mesenet endosymbiont of Phosphuga atrata]|uniref:hypothetical protein n=1 Tax=Candidatus Mesenet endosymbiont of Phosphuga atrata TaxID=3066221 RepID=UPI0030D55E1D
MVNALTLKIEGSVYHDNLKSGMDDSINKVSYTIENGNQVINTGDGLTLQEAYDTLIAMLNGDLDLVKKVLFHAQEMVAYGVYVAQESQLSKHDIYKMINNLKNQSTSIDEIKSLPNIQKDNTKLKKSRKRGRG